MDGPRRAVCPACVRLRAAIRDRRGDIVQAVSAIASLLLATWLAGPPPGPDELAPADDHDPSIYGGEPVEPGAWPAVVAVRTQKLCTGTLVAPDLVLTAAHCFDPAPIGPVQIQFGDSLDSNAIVGAAEWGSHPGFCLPSECGDDIHDFAWVRLAQAVDIDPVLPITSQSEYDDAMVDGREVVFVGYGQDEQDVTGVKREVTSEITSFNDSGREFKAGGGGLDSCFGDSGGPALIQLASGEWRLAGVLSRGGECGKGGIYGVPLPELCWVRDSSGTDLLPEGCGGCDCVDITPERDKGCACTLPVESGERSGWLAMLIALALLGGVRRPRGLE